jgi:hypothetical protein
MPNGFVCFTTKVYHSRQRHNPGAAVNPSVSLLFVVTFLREQVSFYACRHASKWVKSPLILIEFAGRESPGRVPRSSPRGKADLVGDIYAMNMREKADDGWQDQESP